MTRQRVRPSLLFAFSEPCPTCEGVGRIASDSIVLTRIERALKRFKSQRKEWSLQLIVHPIIDEYLNDGLINNTRRMMWKYKLNIEVKSDESLKTNDFRIILKKSQEDVTEQFVT